MHRYDKLYITEVKDLKGKDIKFEVDQEPDTFIDYPSSEFKLSGVSEKQIVGIARVVRTAYADPTATEGDWSCVDLAPFQPLESPVSLATLKADPRTDQLPLIRQSRLSVMPLTEEHFAHILTLGRTCLTDPCPGA